MRSVICDFSKILISLAVKLPGTDSGGAAEAISAVTPDKKNTDGSFKNDLILNENMESKVDDDEVQTADEIVAKYNKDSVLELKEYRYGFSCQLNRYKPAVCVICIAESVISGA